MNPSEGMSDLNPSSDPSTPVEAAITPPAPDEVKPPPLPVMPPASPSRHPSPPTRAFHWAGLALDLFLVALVWVGIYFRFSWINWNQGADLHPDEYGLTSTLTRLALPRSFDDYFNTRLSPLSPYQKYDENGSPTDPGPDNRMRWGQWPITLIRWAAEITDQTDYGKMRLLGRGLSALADTLALFVIFAIGRRLYNRRIGLLAAALSSLAVMQIQQSHFMTVDNFAVLFTALSMYCAVRVAQAPTLTPLARRSQPPEERGGRRAQTGEGTPLPLSESFPTGEGAGGWGSWIWYALFGVTFGMALASRVNLLPLFGEVLVAAVIAVADRWESFRQENKDVFEAVTDVGTRLVLAAVVGFITFRVTQPMSFRAEKGDTSIFTLRPNPEWVESMKVAQAESNGVGGGPPGEQWTNRPALVFPSLNMVLWGMGLPLGLMAWAGLAWAVWRTAKDGEEWRVHLLPLTWAGGYFLFMGTRWVKSVRYFLPIYPFLILFAAWALIELWNVVTLKAEGTRSGQNAEGSRYAKRSFDIRHLSFAEMFVGILCAIVPLSTLAWAWGFTSIYRRDNTRIQASRWIYQNVPAPFNLHVYTDDGNHTEPLSLPEGLQINAEAPYRIQFESHATGIATEITVGHARNAYDLQTPGRLHVVLAADPDGRQPLAQADMRLQATNTDLRGGAYSVPLGPASLEKGKTYYLFITAPEGGPLNIAGSTISNENWDEGLPLRIEGRDAFGGLYHGLEMSVRWQDNEDKRQMFLNNLAQVDYILLPSQRGLWSASRLPNTYPMTMEYYRALFDGRLGLDLVAQFTSPIVLGPLQVSDLVGTAAWGRAPEVPVSKHEPFNDSAFAAEEAFSVYDHAPVWIFKKRPDFSLDKAAAVLYAIDLTQVVNQGPIEATKAPTLLMLPTDRLAEQRAGGTWHEMFDADGLLNKSQPLGVTVWWLAMLIAGWLAFPLTFVAFGGLADRGYPLAKTVALLVVAWLVWTLGSYQLLPFTRLTIAFGFGALAALSALIGWFRRSELADYVRTHWRHILSVEAITLALFVFDLLIRWGNPDLWHPYYGGEKPMVFSFFNAILKSTYFPPYDPWLAGGYINYYYYGFVVVGLLVKLLGIIPAFAYNLILPTLFALLGINAFCVAYNLVRGRSGNPKLQIPNLTTQYPISSTQSMVSDLQDANSETPTPTPTPNSNSNPPLATRHPSPYLAGLAAALLIVVLGNLGQVRTLLEGFQRAADHGALASSVFGDNDVTAALNGAWRVMTGQTTLPISLGNWYWDATRIVANVIAEQHEGRHGGEIDEFPYFTFLYADLHAHMLDMPLVVLALAWAAAYLLGIGRRQTAGEAVVLWFMGGLVFGVTRATNTWDFPTYLALGVVAVAAAHWLKDPRFTRGNVFAVAWRLAVLVGLAMLLYHPFDQWFASPITKAELFKGTKTPLEPYLYMYGLFFFILVTFLVWETRRWLAETSALILAEAGDWFWPLLLALLVFVVGLGVFLYLQVAVAVIALPLIAWSGLLVLRSQASMPPEKRLVFFLLGTGLALTLFVDVFAIGGDRMNTIFKLYIQAWILFSVGAGAALAWVWAETSGWTPNWRGAWTAGLMVLTACAALYTVTAASAKMRDRFPQRTVDPNVGCQAIPGMPLPSENYANNVSLAIKDQPHSLNGLDYLQWSAYCDHTYFLPLQYDYEAIRWMQDNVSGSPVIAEAQSFDLYRMSSRYAWNTGLPDVVGWDWHQRQERGAIPTEFITQRGREVTDFYTNPDPAQALVFLKKYDVRYIIVGPMERAYYLDSGGLAKFDSLAAQGQLVVAYHNPGVTIYKVQSLSSQ